MRHTVIEYNGITKSLKSWASQYGMNQSTLWYRVFKMKLSMEKALTMPFRRIFEPTLGIYTKKSRKYSINDMVANPQQEGKPSYFSCEGAD